MTTPSALMARDTDADWREIGATEPFWGVITSPEFRRETMDDAGLALFYETGANHMAYIAAQLARIGGATLHVGSALDFGCGVGRLAEPMATYADEVVGLDISPGMLEVARARSAGKVIYMSALPERLFDWINSYIVFQHIPPDRGMELLRELLARLAPGGFVSLHFTIYRDAELELPAETPVQPPPRRISIRAMFGADARAVIPEPPPAPPTGTMLMYDYDLGQLCMAFHRHGIEQLTLIHTDHGGHHGVHILGRR